MVENERYQMLKDAIKGGADLSPVDYEFIETEETRQRQLAIQQDLAPDLTNGNG